MLADLETLGPARRRGAPMIGPDQNAAKLRSARRPPNLGPFPRINYSYDKTITFINPIGDVVFFTAQRGG